MIDCKPADAVIEVREAPVPVKSGPTGPSGPTGASGPSGPTGTFNSASVATVRTTTNAASVVTNCGVGVMLGAFQNTTGTGIALLGLQPTPLTGKPTGVTGTFSAADLSNTVYAICAP